MKTDEFLEILVMIPVVFALALVVGLVVAPQAVSLAVLAVFKLW